MSDFVEGRTFHDAKPEDMSVITDPDIRKKLGLREAPVKKDDDATLKDDGTKKDDFVTPEKYEGKSQEDLLKILVDRDRTVGDQGTRLKKVEDDLDFNKRMADLNRRDVPAPVRDTEPPRQKDMPEYKPDDFIAFKDVEKLIGSAIHDDRKKSIVTSQEKLLNMVGIAHDEGLKTLKGKKIAEGIEQEVSEAMFEHFRPWVEKGYDVSNYLRDGTQWEEAARGVRFRRKEYNYLTDEGKKEAPKTDDIKPMAPVTGESPGGRGAPSYGEEPIRLSDHNKYVMDRFDLSEDEAEKGLREIRDARRRGEAV